MFLDELMLTMPDEESSVGPDNVALLENATEYVCDVSIASHTVVAPFPWFNSRGMSLKGELSPNFTF